MSIDPKELRTAFSRFPTGVTIVTIMVDGTPIGFTANSFTSVSMDPPLLLICPGRQLTSFEEFTTCDSFAVHILPEGQEALATKFATFEGDRFEGEDWSLHPHGVPWFNNMAASFACKRYDSFDAGDHAILVGEVTDFTQQDERGLGFLQGQFFSLGLEAQLEDTHSNNIWVGLIAEHQGLVYLPKTEHGYALPKLALTNIASRREALSGYLETLGIHARIGRVYSIYENSQAKSDYQYFLGSVDSSVHQKDCVKVEDLASLPFADPIEKTMMERFAREYQHRNYGLYIGTEKSGDLHFNKRSSGEDQ